MFFNFPAFSGIPNMACSGSGFFSCNMLTKLFFLSSFTDVEQNNFSQFLQVRRREKEVMFLCLLPFFQTLNMSRILAHYSVPLGKLNGAEHLPW